MLTIFPAAHAFIARIYWILLPSVSLAFPLAVYRFSHFGRRTGTVDCAGMCDCTPSTAFRVTKQARDVGSNDGITFHSFFNAAAASRENDVDALPLPARDTNGRQSGWQMGAIIHLFEQ